MSTVILQVGQCGNQLGQSFWMRNSCEREKCLSRVVYRDRQNGLLRSVNVDSEPKVIRRLLKQVNRSNFAEGSLVVGRRGRGSNWAMGYTGLSHSGEDNLLTSTLEAVRKQTERCDSYTGTIIMHSLSGGTGSGFGSRLCESLRDEYPLQYLLSCTVAPHSGGESPLQNYNSLRCLSWLQRYCDGVLLFNNDWILERFNKLGRETSGIATMNDYVCDCLCGMLLPTDSVTPTNGVSLGMEPWEMVRTLCPLPSNKFILPSNVSKSKDSWGDMCSTLMRTTKTRDQTGKLYSLLSSVVVARGDSTNSFPSYIKTVEDKLRASFSCVSWNPYPVDVWTDKETMAGCKKSSLTLAANTSAAGDVCAGILQRAEEMFNAKAYLHWYRKHGCCQGDFEEAFNTVSQIVEDYTALGK